jgi:hypothetical protein
LARRASTTRSLFYITTIVFISVKKLQHQNYLCFQFRRQSGRMFQFFPTFRQQFRFFFSENSNIIIYQRPTEILQFLSLFPQASFPIRKLHS